MSKWKIMEKQALINVSNFWITKNISQIKTSGRLFYKGFSGAAYGRSKISYRLCQHTA
jgi:hypothetical protein